MRVEEEEEGEEERADAPVLEHVIDRLLVVVLAVEHDVVHAAVGADADAVASLQRVDLVAQLLVLALGLEALPGLRTKGATSQCETDAGRRARERGERTGLWERHRTVSLIWSPAGTGLVGLGVGSAASAAGGRAAAVAEAASTGCGSLSVSATGAGGGVAARVRSRMLRGAPEPSRSGMVASRWTPESSRRAHVTWNALMHLPLVHWTAGGEDGRGQPRRAEGERKDEERKDEERRHTLGAVRLGAELTLLHGRGSRRRSGTLERSRTGSEGDERRTSFHLAFSILANPRTISSPDSGSISIQVAAANTRRQGISLRSSRRLRRSRAEEALTHG